MTGILSYYSRFKMDRARCYIYDGGCWYTLWYVWFILVVGILIIISLAVWCYKFYKYKQRRRRLLRSGNPPPLTTAPGPPGYEEPSHLPPPYEEVIKTRHIPPSTTVIYNCPPPGTFEPWDLPPRTPPTLGLPEVSS